MKSDKATPTTAAICLAAATPADAAAMATMCRMMGEETAVAPSALTSLLADPARVTLLAWQAGRPVGFVYAFGTSSAAGQRRWEIDLLAVDPRARGFGIGRRLVAGAIERAHGCGIARPFLARALVRLGNRPAERCLAGAGCRPGPGLALFIAPGEGGVTAVPAAPGAAYLCPLRTLSYTGWWLEGTFEPATLAAVASARAAGERAGAAIPLADKAGLLAARSAYWIEIGRFRWWSRLAAGAASRAGDAG